jgi:hypothetical protein
MGSPYQKGLEAGAAISATVRHLPAQDSERHPSAPSRLDGRRFARASAYSVALFQTLHDLSASYGRSDANGCRRLAISRKSSASFRQAVHQACNSFAPRFHPGCWPPCITCAEISGPLRFSLPNPALNGVGSSRGDSQ